MFVAPSQLKRVGDRFPGWKFQIVVSRSENRDMLTVRIDASETKQGKDHLASFEKHFAEICTVRIDRIEELPQGTLGEGYKPIVDDRSWK
jgi:phenylacetate-coenzyme A ligase PaaK-like adenylate-forming protein